VFQTYGSKREDTFFAKVQGLNLKFKQQTSILLSPFADLLSHFSSFRKQKRNLLSYFDCLLIPCKRSPTYHNPFIIAIVGS